VREVLANCRSCFTALEAQNFAGTNRKSYVLKRIDAPILLGQAGNANYAIVKVSFHVHALPETYSAG
jgi:hypothetical protein